MSWTDERVEKLKTLWAEGLSASQIAGVLGEVTRNAVIGKVHRLGLAGRAKSSSTAGSRTPKPAATTRRSAKIAKPAATPAAAAGYSSVGAAVLQSCPADQQAPLKAVALNPEAHCDQEKTGILDLNDGTCRWPIGDPGQEGFHFCGQNPRASGGPYCDFHARIAYQPVQQRGTRRLQVVSA